MSFLSYSNDHQVNIIPQDEFESLIKDVFNVIASNLTKSLGPLGSSATILDGMMTEATKDGYSILMKYRFHNRYKKMIYNLITAPCTKMNNTVGDGTTTAIALTSAIFDSYEANKNYLNTLYRLPRQFINAWDEVISTLIKMVEDKATPIDPEDYDTIYHLAYVTSNGNKEISDAIARTYQSAHTPSIKQKDSPTNKSYIQDVNGFEFPANLIADAFVRNEDGTAIEKDIAVMIFDYKIESDTFTNVIVPINEVFRAMNKKLVILAPSYDAHMCDTVVNQYVNREYNSYQRLNLILTQYAYGKLNKHQLADLAVVLRAKLITQEIGASIDNAIASSNIDKLVEDIMNNDEFSLYRTIGRANEAILSTTNGAIFHADDIAEDKVYQETLAAARRDLETIKANTPNDQKAYAAKIYDAQSRVLQLEMKNFIYYIGADSALQKQITWDSVEDVIKCLRSAIKYGVVPGCQLSIIAACSEYWKQLNESKDTNKLKMALVEIIHNSVANVYLQVLHGANGDGMVKLIENWDLVGADHVDELRNRAIEKGKEILNNSIKCQKVFDLETLEYNDAIITSAQTDTMVLTAASELVKILISGNQCVFLDSEINDVHEDTVDAYV